MGEAVTSKANFERLERQAQRMGCRVVTAQAFEEFSREARELRGAVVEANRRAAKAERERDKLRREVGILHFRLKSPWGRLVSRWKIWRLNREPDLSLGQEGLWGDDDPGPIMLGREWHEQWDEPHRNANA